MEQSVADSDFSKLRQYFNIGAVDANAYSPLALAYIGDTVYDMVFRTLMVASCNMAAHKYHKKVCAYVSAVAQSEMVEQIRDIMTEKEMEIYKRGRNSRPAHKAKNASAVEYQRATGLEALVGYLYLNDQMDRIYELIRYGINKQDKAER